MNGTGKKALLILGNQLFDLSEILSVEKRKEYIVFMREDYELCTFFQFHKHKLVFFLLAMRKYAEELRSIGFSVHYEVLDEKSGRYEERFSEFLKDTNCSDVHFFEIEDKFFEKRIREKLQILKIPSFEHPSPMFLTSRPEFKKYLEENQKPFMKTFYVYQRKKLNILLNEDKSPIGGKWSFDTENRKRIPKNYKPPIIPKPNHTAKEMEIFHLIDQKFPHHPGNSSEFWLPTTRADAKDWFLLFLKERLQNFGPYEDALSMDFPFLNHSILTPFLNLGLLTPKEIVKETLMHFKRYRLPLESVEGFLRQIIGWREFVRGIYQNYEEVQFNSNFFSHTRLLTQYWYEGTTGIPPLDHVIHKCNRYAYAHHIERLMIVSSLMLLFEVHPKEAYKWFMEMFIDSSDWVMGPNVFGMGLFSDGGIFSTKPYICASNYYRKMGSYPKGEWEVAVDGLYWSFVERHRDFFSKNPRTKMIVQNLHRMDAKKKKHLFASAEEWKNRLTIAPTTESF